MWRTGEDASAASCTVGDDDGDDGGDDDDTAMARRVAEEAEAAEAAEAAQAAEEAEAAARALAAEWGDARGEEIAATTVEGGLGCGTSDAAVCAAAEVAAESTSVHRLPSHPPSGPPSRPPSRPPSQPPSVGPSPLKRDGVYADGAAEEWACNACTLLNPSSNRRCGVCDAIRGSSLPRRGHARAAGT